MTIASMIGNRVYRVGDSGPVVQQIQQALAKIGFQLSGTGYFGPATDTAVETFQRRAGLSVDGEVGTATARAIDAALAAPRPASTAPANPEIDRPLWLQVSLANLGLHEGVGKANNPVLIKDIQEVAADYTADEIPWCAGWVSFCLARSGYKPSKQPLWALSYADGWGVKLAGPAVGAIAVKSRTGGGHVTFVAGRTASGLLACCGGNQNDEVNISGYGQSIFNHGFWWPKSIALPNRIGIGNLPIVKSDGRVSTKES